MARLGHAVRDYRLQLMYSLMDREGFDALLFTQADFSSSRPTSIPTSRRGNGRFCA